MGDLITLSDVRKQTGQPAHVINHALDRYGPEPAGRIGIARVWHREDLPKILAALEKTGTRRHRSEAATR